MPSLEPVLEVYARLYPALADWSPPFRLLHAIQDVRNGTSVEDAAKAKRFRPAKLEPLLAGGDPIKILFGHSWAECGDDHPKSKAARKSLGQMVLGHVAERVFEALYKREIGNDDLVLEDSRETRNETDYRVLDANRHPVFRINIKFHGTLFRKAEELVGLDPEDCFALATYKIWQGHKKNELEKLPYVFLVVSAPELSGETVGQSIPDDFARLSTLLRASVGVNDLRKRDVEDAMAKVLIGPDAPAAFVPIRDHIVTTLEAADWRALSAERAKRLVHKLLFERVFAVRVRGFAQNYRNAELDMHFSLTQDMTTLHDFLSVYTKGGLHALTSQLARGDI
jgi:hypothetical protein